MISYRHNTYTGLLSKAYLLQPRAVNTNASRIFPALYDLSCSILGKNLYSGKNSFTHRYSVLPKLIFPDNKSLPSLAWDICEWKLIKSQIAGAMQGNFKLLFVNTGSKYCLKLLPFSMFTSLTLLNVNVFRVLFLYMAFVPFICGILILYNSCNIEAWVTDHSSCLNGNVCYCRLYFSINLIFTNEISD